MPSEDKTTQDSMPQAVLTQLEDEPLSGFYGCTYTEVLSALRRALLVWLVAAIVLLPFIFWTFAAILAMPVGIWQFMRRVRQASALREGKPLFYHRHAMNYRSRRFIQPAERYQRERTR